MLGYVTLGVADIGRAHAFYDALLKPLGGRRMLEDPEHNGFTWYGTGPGQPGFVITGPWDGDAASVGNGTMVAFKCESRAVVDAFHARAVSLGAADDGAPGLRTAEGPRAFYGAYVRDPDGNKLCGYATGPG
jgi:catechol 2,3-dioxygenase-like lactoylglutathione lyase family enzyme